MSRTARVLVALTICAATMHAQSQKRPAANSAHRKSTTEDTCQRITFGGEVSASEDFRREIGNGLAFRLDPWKEASGWEFEIGPVSPQTNEWDQYVYTLTPPYRSSSARDINTGWGTTAQDAIRRDHSFQFLIRREDAQKATTALDRVLWPKTDKDQEQALAVLDSLPRGNGELEVVDSKFTPGTTKPGYGDCEEGKCGAIQWIRFEVRLVVPGTFRAAAGVEVRNAKCEIKEMQKAKVKMQK